MGTSSNILHTSTLLDTIHKHAQEGADIRTAFFARNGEKITETAHTLATALKNGHKVLACGNGGSAADASHLVGELMGRFMIEREPFPAVDLAASHPLATAIGNDYGYEELFARQIRGLGEKGDILFALSTSGKSPNVLEALKAGKTKNLYTVGLCGQHTESMAPLCDVLFSVPSATTPLVQETHMALLHVLCMLSDQILFS